MLKGRVRGSCGFDLIPVAELMARRLWLRPNSGGAENRRLSPKRMGACAPPHGRAQPHPSRQMGCKNAQNLEGKACRRNKTSCVCLLPTCDARVRLKETLRTVLAAASWRARQMHLSLVDFFVNFIFFVVLSTQVRTSSPPVASESGMMTQQKPSSAPREKIEPLSPRNAVHPRQLCLAACLHSFALVTSSKTKHGAKINKKHGRIESPRAFRHPQPATFILPHSTKLRQERNKRRPKRRLLIRDEKRPHS